MIVAIIGEEWEAGVARATANSFADWLPEGTEICIPSEFERAVSGLCPRTPRVIPVAGNGFHAYEDVRRSVLKMERNRCDGLLLLAAGTLPARRKPIERLGASCVQPRTVEWIPPAEVEVASIFHFSPPPHRPPINPHHVMERVGALEVWTVDGGDNYFQAMADMEGLSNPPIWAQYGAHRPIFIYNTNEFDEPPPAAHDEYFILGSGLLGLRMIVESRPAVGAHIVVYDINPQQLLWIRFILDACDKVDDFEQAVEMFRETHSLVEIRQTLPHESTNASLQSAWYRRHRHHLAEVAAKVDWEFVTCDLWNEPGPLLRRIRRGRSLFFMYLDLFMVWHIGGDIPWVENHVGTALSLEEVVKARVQAPVTFLPSSKSARFQLHPESPLASS